MIILKSIRNDMKFQQRYGFYLLYLLLTMIYIGIIFALPESARLIAASILIFSDPAALGLFFMGAIILFEKSERVLNSLFISPLKIDEYILSKVASLSFISTLVGISIALAISPQKVNIISLVLGLMLGSILFSLAGLIAATRISSLNQFMIRVIPLGTLLSMPSFAILFGFDNSILQLHPGAIVLELILHGVGIMESDIFSILILIAWIAVFWFWARINTQKMLGSLGGVKL